MAVVEQPLPRVEVQQLVPEPQGLTGWFTTVDHKRIGILYLIAAFIFFAIGGIEALLMRIQLGAPENTFLSPDMYNQLFTMHGTTMIFLAIMPMGVGLGNYVVPLQIGARDMAFPRLNAMSVWLFILGGLMLYFSFMVGGGPAAGWFAYVPLSNRPYSPTHGMDYWVLGLTMTGVASIAGSLNFIVTILNMRAPGMRLNRMPLFTWMMLVMSFVLIFAFPSLTAAQIMLLFDRNFGTHFFRADQGGNPILYQHLFWFFGHPEVYIMILPAFGIISELTSTFSRKPYFGYAFLAYSGVAIGFLGFLVWAHHMFAVGLGPVANAFFAGASMLIAVPTGVKIFNWIGTLWGGSINMKTALYFAVGFISMFIIGGISGITLASPPVDLQQTDTYYVVAHFHYVLFGGSMLGLFGAIYYWFPKMTGRLLDERLGKIHFWLTMIGFNLTFGPMHWVGTLGMPRRIYTYEAGMGYDIWNLIETIAAFLIALGVLMFFYNVVVSVRKGEIAGDDPWDGSTLEWATPSPPPSYNFARTPVVFSRRPVWDIKYPELDLAHAKGVRAARRDSGVQADAVAASNKEPIMVHMPSPTIYPLIVAVGLMLAFFGILYTFILSAIGLLIIAYGIHGWIHDANNDSWALGAAH
jgi:cytochrome c oxidase subunit 1